MSPEGTAIDPEEGTGGPVLFAYDGSDHAKSAIETAGRQLRTGRPATVLTVVEPLDALPFWGAPMSMIPDEVFEEITVRAQRAADEGAALARAAGFDAVPLLERGAPVWKRIVAVSEEQESGLVVLGSHGRAGVRYAVMGSVATAVAHHATRPVMITRAG